MRSTTTFVFLAIDVPLYLLRRIAAVVDIVFFHQTLDQTHLIITVEYLKILRQFRFPPVLFQQAVCQTMKGTYP